MNKGILKYIYEIKVFEKFFLRICKFLIICQTINIFLYECIPKVILDDVHLQTK